MRLDERDHGGWQLCWMRGVPGRLKPALRWRIPGWQNGPDRKSQGLRAGECMGESSECIRWRVLRRRLKAVPRQLGVRADVDSSSLVKPSYAAIRRKLELSFRLFVTRECPGLTVQDNFRPVIAADLVLWHSLHGWDWSTSRIWCAALRVRAER